jgi:hypothetical protein
MMDMQTREFAEKKLFYEGNAVREFLRCPGRRVVVGIEATGAMQWFLELLEELGIEYRVGHPAKIRAHISSAACRFICAKNFFAESWFNNRARSS